MSYFTITSVQGEWHCYAKYFLSHRSKVLLLLCFMFSSFMGIATTEKNAFSSQAITKNHTTDHLTDYPVFESTSCRRTRINKLVVVNWNNGHEVLTIYNGDVVNLADLPANCYLKVKTGYNTESVSIDLNGHKVCENRSPYTYPAGGSIWQANVGHYTLRAKTYKENRCENGYGSVCDEKTFRFEVVDDECETAKINGLVVMNRQNDQEVLSISDGDVVNLADLPSSYYLKVKTGNGTASVSLDLNGYRICENVPPYTYPAGGNQWHASLGHHTLRAKTYTEDGCEGRQGVLCDEKIFNFEVIENQCEAAKVEGLVIVNRYNGQEVLSIADGDVVNLADLPSSYYLKVKTGNSTESVSIEVNGHRICEDLPPYTYPAGGGYWNASEGNYTLTAKTYTENNCESGYGELCDEKNFHFEMIDERCLGAKIDALVLIDASSDQEVLTITDGDKININNLPENYYLQINSGNDTESVSLKLNGHQICENYIPYTYPAGSANWNAGLGNYTLVAKTYTKGSCESGYGLLCNQISISFEIIEACELEVDLGDDVTVCEGEETTLHAMVSNISDCSSSSKIDCYNKVVDYGGYVTSSSSAEVCGDYSGSKLWTAGGYGLSYLSLDFGEVAPAGTEICVLAKLEHCSGTYNNFARMEVQTSVDFPGSGFSNSIAEENLYSSSYQEFCYTLNTAARYVTIVNGQNSCSMRLDYVSYETPVEGSNEVTYEWSGPGIVGAIDGSSIITNQSGTYTVLVTDCKGCTASDEVVVNISNPNIEGVAFEDTDGDGCYDPMMESVIGGLTVSLQDCNGNAVTDNVGNPIQSITDATTGKYSFDVCDLGDDFIVNFEIPEGFVPTQKNAAGCSDINSNINDNGDSDCTPSDPDGPDAGFTPCSSITGVAFIDANVDGCFDTDESVVGDLTVFLLFCDGTDVLDENGNPVITTTDATTGVYVFTDVCQYGENFIVKFEIPIGFAPTGVRNNEFCFEGATNSNIDEFGESECVDDNPDGPDAGFVESLPEIATSVQILISEIVVGGNTDIIYRIANLGSGPTNGSLITFTITKNPNFGTFTLGALPTGWSIANDHADSVELVSNNMIGPVATSGVVTFTANFEHDGDAENTTILFDAEIGKGSGGDQNELNNQNSAILSIN